jgi:hypothetical protein
MLLCKAVQGAALCAGMLDLRLSAASVSQSEEHVSHSQHLLSTRLLVVGECAFCAFCAFLRFLRFSQWWAFALFAMRSIMVPDQNIGLTVCVPWLHRF